MPQTQADSATIRPLPRSRPRRGQKIVIRVAGYPPFKEARPLCETQSIHFTTVVRQRNQRKGDAWKKMERGCDCA